MLTRYELLTFEESYETEAEAQKAYEFVSSTFPPDIWDESVDLFLDEFGDGASPYWVLTVEWRRIVPDTRDIL